LGGRRQDVVARRLRLAFLDANAAESALPSLAAVMAKELRWSDQRRAAEIANAKDFLKTMRAP